jgi:hypothetical protein
MAWLFAARGSDRRAQGRRPVYGRFIPALGNREVTGPSAPWKCAPSCTPSPRPTSAALPSGNPRSAESKLAYDEAVRGFTAEEHQIAEANVDKAAAKVDTMEGGALVIVFGSYGRKPKMEGRRVMSENRSMTPPAGAGILCTADLKCRMAEREAPDAAEELTQIHEQEEKQKTLTAAREETSPCRKARTQLSASFGHAR